MYHCQHDNNMPPIHKIAWLLPEWCHHCTTQHHFWSQRLCQHHGNQPKIATVVWLMIFLNFIFSHFTLLRPQPLQQDATNHCNKNAANCTAWLVVPDTAAVVADTEMTTNPLVPEVSSFCFWCPCWHNAICWHASAGTNCTGWLLLYFFTPQWYPPCTQFFHFFQEWSRHHGTVCNIAA